MSYSTHIVVSGKILPGHVAHINTDIPGGSEGSPVAAPDPFLPLIEDGFDAVVFTVGQFGEQRQQFIDRRQTPDSASGKPGGVELLNVSFGPGPG